MQILVTTRLDPEQHETCWRLHERVFAELRPLAVERHALHRSEFDELANDERVDKYLALDDTGTLAGFGTITTAIETLVLLEPMFFAARWPEHYAARRVYYNHFVVTPPEATDGAAFDELIQAFAGRVPAEGGVVVLDMSRERIRHGLHSAILRRLRRFKAAAVELSSVDEQVCFAYEFSPTVAGSSPGRTISLIDEQSASTTREASGTADAGIGLP